MVEVASNDGYLLQHFVAMGVPVLGIEPTANTAEAARASGVRTEVPFFNAETAAAPGRARRPRRPDGGQQRAGPRARHRRLRRGLPHVLKHEGVLTFEFPHLLNLIEQGAVRHDLPRALLLPVAAGGGAGACAPRPAVVRRRAAADPRRLAAAFLWACTLGPAKRREHWPPCVPSESAAGLDRIETYRGFAPRVESVREVFEIILQVRCPRGGAFQPMAPLPRATPS